MKTSLRLVLLLAVAVGVVVQVAAAPAASRLPVAEIARKLGAGYTQVRREAIPVQKLRGYGELSGDFVLYQSAAGQVSALAIQCADVSKAKIVHAKYLSDLHLVLAVQDETVAVGAVPVPAVNVPDQGRIAAFRQGAVVYIAAGTDGTQLAALLGALPLTGAELTPTGEVPLYLDSWDKHGFRFYYGSFNTPPPKSGERGIEWKDYNVLGEFDWAKQYGQEGFVFWQNEEKCDFAEGMDNDLIFEYGARACANRGLPVVINTAIADAVWLVNRYRDDTQWKMPGYVGGFYTPCDAFHAGLGHLAWSADDGLDAVLSVMQKTWRDYAKRPTTIEYLEPHAELRHGDHDLLNEYGPSADKSYREYLKEKYATPAAVGQRWYGKPEWVRTWSDVRVPELVRFFGYTSRAFDLTGEWRLKYEDFADGKAMPTTPAPEDWYLPATSDADWPALKAPGNDQPMFLQRRPAIWRRHFTLPAAWKADKPKVWLYVFSLNRGNREPAPIYLNGKKVGEPLVEGRPSWAVVEVTDALQVGDNLLALRLPRNFLGYRAYLTGEPPANYPYLGEQLNAQWVDFTRWLAWVHQRAMRRSFEAIRESDPDRSVVCMAPDSFLTQVEELCQDYGGHFHNTGYMGGWWAEQCPMMMRAAGLPMSVEPGNPAHNLTEFKGALGNWLTEGVNSVHYFMHVGDVYWDDSIRTWFEQHQAIIGAFGKLHVPQAEVAMLYGDDVNNLTGWPWSSPDGSGYVLYQFNVGLHKEYHMDGVSPQDFKRGNANAYKVVVDTNSCIMDPALVSDLEAWVKQGGIFVTMNDTGRHTPEKADSWPISRLTGYKVTGYLRHPNSAVTSFAPGQPVFDAATWDENARRAQGQILEPVSPDCVPLLLWPDGKAVIGMRKLGAGYVIDMGYDNFRNPLLLRQIFAWAKLRQIPGYCDLDKINSTHEVSNNGLYDVWICWNWEQKDNTSNLIFRDGLQPPYLVDLQTQEKLVPVVENGVAKLTGLAFGPGDIRILAAPRRQIGSASLGWLNLQRGWWRGTTAPSRKVPTYQARFALNLNEQWRMKLLDDGDASDHAALAAPGLDDKTWKVAELGPWLVPEDQPTHRAFFRKQFTVPANWNHGEIDVWFKSWMNEVMWGRMRVWIDGKEILASGRQIIGQDQTALLPPGAHLMAVEVMSEGEVAGLYGNTWLAYLPTPAAKLDLGGPWKPSVDGLTWQDPINLPGPLGKATMVTRRILVNPPPGQTVMLFTETDGRCNSIGVVVNGQWVRRHHHVFGNRTYLNITPWIKFGQENEFLIPCNPGDGQGAFTSLELRYFPAGTAP
ncbi:MAG TPA: hypothetical protein VGM19_08280 [Armatimonadota bacterium]|jgi:hypothetical protein